MSDHAARLEAKFARLEAEQKRRAAEDRKARGVCACGHKLADCRPEICSHRFARDAMWGNS